MGFFLFFYHVERVFLPCRWCCVPICSLGSYGLTCPSPRDFISLSLNMDRFVTKYRYSTTSSGLRFIRPCDWPNGYTNTVFFTFSSRFWQERCGGAPPADGGQRSRPGRRRTHPPAQRLLLRPRRGGQSPPVSGRRPQCQRQLELHTAPRGRHQGQDRRLHRWGGATRLRLRGACGGKQASRRLTEPCPCLKLFVCLRSVTSTRSWSEYSEHRRQICAGPGRPFGQGCSHRSVTAMSVCNVFLDLKVLLALRLNTIFVSSSPLY